MHESLAMGSSLSRKYVAVNQVQVRIHWFLQHVTSSDAKLNFCLTGEYFSLGTKSPNDLYCPAEQLSLAVDHRLLTRMQDLVGRRAWNQQLNSTGMLHMHLVSSTPCEGWHSHRNLKIPSLPVPNSLLKHFTCDTTGDITWSFIYYNTYRSVALTKID